MGCWLEAACSSMNVQSASEIEAYWAVLRENTASASCCFVGDVIRWWMRSSLLCLPRLVRGRVEPDGPDGAWRVTVADIGVDDGTASWSKFASTVGAAARTSSGTSIISAVRETAGFEATKAPHSSKKNSSPDATGCSFEETGPRFWSLGTASPGI